jgi:hypothetical protein
MHIWSHARGGFRFERTAGWASGRAHNGIFLGGAAMEEFPPCSGRGPGGEGRSQLCVWYVLIIDGQLNVF